MASESQADGVQAPRSVSASNRGERLAKIGTIASAIVASSCCWLPPLLIGLGLLFGFSADRVIAALQGSLATYRPVFMVVTFGCLGLAFYFTYRPRRAAAEGCAADC